MQATKNNSRSFVILFIVIRHHAKAFKIVERGGGGGGRWMRDCSLQASATNRGISRPFFLGGGGANLTLQRTTKNSLSRTGFELESSGF